MDIFQTIILALVQGISEFLPISSSAHLILIPKVMEMPDQGLAFDVVMHFGTLSAIVFYYRQALRKIFFASFRYKPSDNEDSKLGWGILLATLPTGLTGLLLQDFIAHHLRATEVIAYSTIFFGLLLGLADYLNRKNLVLKQQLSWLVIGFIGIMQTLALIPGTSRSGIVITAGLLIGLSRNLSVKFAFLLSIPIILLSSLLTLVDLYKQPELIDLTLLFIGFIISAISSYLVVFLFIKTIEKISMLPFVLYRLLLGIGLLIL